MHEAHPTRQRLVLQLDSADALAVERALARRESWRDRHGRALMPEGDSNTAGALLAEICRGWEEMLQARTAAPAATGN